MKKKMGLSTQIFAALLIGAVIGVLIHYVMPSGTIRDEVLVEGILYVVGQGFIRLMQMLVVPLVFCSLVCGSMAIGDTKTLEKLELKPLVFILLQRLWPLPLHWQVPISSIRESDLIWMPFRQVKLQQLRRAPVLWIHF